MWSSLILLSVSCLSLSEAALPLPPYIKPCARTDPNINDCVVKHANEAIPTLIKGDRKYKIPPLDPLDIEEVKIVNEAPRSAGISMTLRNAKVHGMKNVRFEKANMNFVKKQNHFEVKVPLVKIIGKYEVSGRILVLPINGKGDIELTLENVYVVYDEDWKLVERDGDTYLQVVNAKAIATPGNMHINITNLFNGDKLLGDQMNTFLNENWREVSKELSPTIFAVFSRIVNSTASGINTAVPYDSLFPEKLPS